jgi:hypothetical protein
MAKNPPELIKALNEVINGGEEPETTLKKHGLR